MSRFEELDGIIGPDFQIGLKGGPAFSRVGATARLKLPDQMRFLASAGRMVTDGSGDVSLSAYVYAPRDVYACPNVGVYTEDGSIDRPFKTITDALLHAATLAPPPSLSAPVRIICSAGVFSEPRPAFVPGVTESILALNYSGIYIFGAGRGATVIRPASEVGGEAMNLIAGVQPGAAPGTPISVGLANLTLADCTEGSALEWNSYSGANPEFRCFLSNVGITNCDVGLETVQDNCWTLFDNLYLYNCYSQGIYTSDSAVVVGTNMLMLGDAPAGNALYALTSSSMDISNIIVGKDYGVPGVLYSELVLANNSNIRLRGGSLQSGNVAYQVQGGADLKCWDIDTYDISWRGAYSVDTADRVELIDCQLDDQVFVVSGCTFKMHGGSVNVPNESKHAVHWLGGAGGDLDLDGVKIVHYGNDGANWFGVFFENAPSTFRMNNCNITYDPGHAAPAYNVYSNVAFTGEIDGNTMDIGLHGNVRTNNNQKYVGYFKDQYKTMADVNVAVAAGDTVNVGVGTFIGKIAPVASVTYKGVNRSQTIIQDTDDVMDMTSADSINVEDLTLNATPPVGPASRFFDFTSSCVFRRCNFTWTDPGGGTVPYISADALTKMAVESLLECDVRVGITINEATANIFVLVADQNTKFTRDLTMTLSGGDQFVVANSNLNNVTLTYDSSAGTSVLLIFGSRVYSSAGDAIVLNSGGGTYKFQLKNCLQVTGGNRGIVFNHAPSEVVMLGTPITGGVNGDIVVNGVAITDAVYQDCLVANKGVMCTGGGSFSHINDEWHVGGYTDSYFSIADAIVGLDRNNVRIVLHEDQNIVASLLVPAYNTTIEQYSIQFAGGGTICTLGNLNRVRFRNMKLVGRVVMDGTEPKLTYEAVEHSGGVRIDSGTSDAVFLMDQVSRIIGTATDPHALRIDATDPHVIVRQESGLKGQAGSAAIRWVQRNDNLKMTGGATVLHGSLGVNNPFVLGGGVALLHYEADHSCFNEDPDINPLIINQIPPGMRFNTFSPLCDF